MNSNPILDNSFLGSKYFNPEYLFNQGALFFHQFYIYISSPQTAILFNFILSCFAIFFITIIAYTLIRMFEIRAKEHKYLHHEIAEYAKHYVEKEKKLWEGEEISKNERWVAVLKHLFEPNQSDWKLAIIESDSMLESLLEQLGFKGENIGERLKGADVDKFRNLSLAWEVHAVRNKIAHEGLAFQLSLHEAKRVIALYEQIFRQYGYI